MAKCVPENVEVVCPREIYLLLAQLAKQRKDRELIGA